MIAGQKHKACRQTDMYKNPDAMKPGLVNMSDFEIAKAGYKNGEIDQA